MLIAMLLAPALGLAQADSATEDARCIVAATKLEEFADEADKAGVRGTMLFYLGKLAANHDAGEVRALIEQAEAQVTDNDVPVLGMSCGQALIDLGQAVGV